MSMPPVPPGSDDRESAATLPSGPSDADAFSELALDAPSIASQRKVLRPRRRFRRRLVLRLALLLSISVLFPLIVEGFWFYHRARNEAIRLHLGRAEVALDIVFTDLDQCLKQRRARLGAALDMDDVRAALAAVWSTAPDSPEFQEVRAELLRVLDARTRTPRGVSPYVDFALITPDQTVLVASNPEWEGKSLAAVPFGPTLQRQWQAVTHEVLHWLYAAPSSAAMRVGTAYPLRDAEGRLQGVLIGLSSTHAMQQGLRRLGHWLPQGESALLTEDGQVYVWDSKTQTLRLVDQPRLAQFVPVLAQEPRETVLIGEYSRWEAWLAQWGLGPAQRVVPYAPTNEQVLYPLWRVETADTFGLAGWIEPLRVALVVTTPSSIVMTKVLAMLRMRLLFWGLLLALTLGVAALFGRRLLRQVHDLVRVAEAFAQGRWDERAEVVGDDEMALLAYTFNDLADQLQETYATMERELNLRTQQVQLVTTMATVALEAGPEAERVLNTILQRMSERFPRFAYLSLRLWHAPDQGWQLAAQVSHLPETVNVALRSLEPQLASEVVRTLDIRTWTHHEEEGQTLRLPAPLSWIVGVPLSTPQRFVGVLFVGSVDTRLPGEYDRFALRLLARQLALVLEYLHLQRSRALESEKQQVLREVLARLPSLRHSSQLMPTLVEALERAKAQGVLLVPSPELTDIWNVAYPQTKNGQEAVVMRNLLALIGEGPAHLAADESEGTGIATLARLYDWQTVGLYPVREPQGRILAVWARGTRAGERETPLDREREHLFADLLGWAYAYVEAQQRLSVWEVVRQILAYAPEAPSEGHLYLRAWELLQQYLPEADFFVASYRGGTPLTFIYPHGQRYYHTTVTPVSQALIQQVLERGQPLLLSDKHKVIAQAGKAMRIATRVPSSWLGVPLVLGQQRLGVLGLMHWDKARAFSEEHLAYLRILGQGLAGVMYFIQQEGRLRRRIEREQSLRTFAQGLTGLTNIRNLLEFSAAEIQRLFEAREVEIELFAAPAPDDEAAKSNGDAGQEGRL